MVRVEQKTTTTMEKLKVKGRGKGLNIWRSRRGVAGEYKLKMRSNKNVEKRYE